MEDTHHIVFDCSLYADVRERYSQLFPPAGLPHHRLYCTHVFEQASLRAFLEGTCAATARFTCKCRRRARQRLGQPP